ncbi:MAG: XisI protein [Chloroflexota bacterium]
MDKLTTYQQLIKRLLGEIADLVNRQAKSSDEEMVCVFDDERGHYMLITAGWTKKERLRYTTLYVRLRNGKIWIEEDWTEEGIATDLVRAGVPKEDIVLGFQPPEMRPYTEFAVA